jgi:hypothetical protein
MEQSTDWEGFPIRLRMAISRWPAGGQRAFAKALGRYAKKNGIVIPTSYRTLVNYLNGKTRPRHAWVEAAAAMLRTSPEALLTGVQVEDVVGARFGYMIEDEDRPEMISDVLLEDYRDLPEPAFDMVWHFMAFYFEGDDDGWGEEDRPRRTKEIRAALRYFFGPLLARPSTSYAATMALAASVTATAYMRIVAGTAKPEED